MTVEIVFELSSVLFLYLLHSLSACFFWKDIRASEIQKGWSLGKVTVFLNTVGIICLILYIGARQENGLKAIGIHLDQSYLTLFGIYAYSLLVLVVYLVSRKSTQIAKGIAPLTDAKVMRSFLTTPQKLFHVTCMALCAVEEELVFRGYLILLWGKRTNMIIPIAVVSSILFILSHRHHFENKNHLYWTILFTFVVTLSTLLFNNIMLALGMHIFGNILMTVKVWTLERRLASQETPPSPVSLE